MQESTSCRGEYLQGIERDARIVENICRKLDRKNHFSRGCKLIVVDITRLRGLAKTYSSTWILVHLDYKVKLPQRIAYFHFSQIGIMVCLIQVNWVGCCPNDVWRSKHDDWRNARHETRQGGWIIEV